MANPGLYAGCLIQSHSCLSCFSCAFKPKYLQSQLCILVLHCVASHALLPCISLASPLHFPCISRPPEMQRLPCISGTFSIRFPLIALLILHPT